MSQKRQASLTLLVSIEVVSNDRPLTSENRFALEGATHG
jgi:hypothetical protein